MPARMSTRHVLLALLLGLVWGVNFVVIKVGLDHFPPLLFSALRFLVAAVPAISVLRWPVCSPARSARHQPRPHRLQRRLGPVMNP